MKKKGREEVTRCMRRKKRKEISVNKREGRIAGMKGRTVKRE